MAFTPEQSDVLVASVDYANDTKAVLLKGTLGNVNGITSGYLDGNIDDGAMSFYLGRMYEMKNNRTRLQMENPYTAEEQINKLIKELGLEERKMKVQHDMP